MTLEDLNTDARYQHEWLPARALPEPQSVNNAQGLYTV
jgi:hypothetical protein